MAGQRAGALHSHGMRLSHAPYTPPADPTPDTFTDIDEVTIGSETFHTLVSCRISGAGTDDIDVSTLYSADKIKEYIPGLGEEGTMELEWHGPLEMKVIVDALVPLDSSSFPDYGKQRYKITDPRGDEIVWYGYMHKPNITYELNNVVKITASVKLSGPISETTVA